MTIALDRQEVIDADASSSAPARRRRWPREYGLAVSVAPRLGEPACVGRGKRGTCRRSRRLVGYSSRYGCSDNCMLAARLQSDLQAVFAEEGLQTMITTRTIAIVLLLGFGAGNGSSGEQDPQAQNSGKKLYCWTDNGRKVCGDALPPEAAAKRARTEISAKSGMHTGEVARALTPEERAAADAAAEQAQVAADAEAARQRQDLAMVESYGTEDDLRRAYGERIGLLDASIKASQLGVSNLRLSLTSLLNQASDLELSGKPVSAGLLANVRLQHLELQKQQRILARQQSDRSALDGELDDAVTRYRALKQKQAGTVAELPAPTSGG